MKRFPIKKIFMIFLCFFYAHNMFSHQQRYNIGLLIVATGRYIEFVSPLIESAEKYFCKNHNVTYFVFTDGVAPSLDNVVSIYQKRLGWPYDTMMRFDMYVRNQKYLKEMDYVFACDADMLFVDSVGDEILGDLVGTLHPGFYGQKNITYDTNSNSTAYVCQGVGTYYFAGGFNGGKRENYLAMAEEITNNIKNDLARNVIAVWHDESHLNKYFIYHPPSVILTPSYCYQEGTIKPYPQKLIALDKDHKVYQVN